MNSSEIITNIDGSIYHLSLKPEQVSCDIILVGDPFRVDEVSKFMNDIEFTTQNREFRSVTGYYNKKRISVISTGIGGSNIDIVINEIDALVNYDFEKKYQIESLEFINKRRWDINLYNDVKLMLSEESPNKSIQNFIMIQNKLSETDINNIKTYDLRNLKKTILIN